jgi:hypothetical protein
VAHPRLADAGVLTPPPSAFRPLRPSRWGLLLAAGWLVQAGLRAWLSRAQVVPLATPDESAYLIAARVLAGGVPANFSYSTLYPAGYPLLITPVFWFTGSPVTAYHAVLAINAVVSAAILPLAYDATVVEVAWPAGQPARSSWPQAPAGWRIVAADATDGWVAWRRR